MLSYTRCNHCNEIVPELEEQMKGNFFLYCSAKCRDVKEEERRQKRIHEMKTHHPWDRMTKGEQEKLKESWGIAGPVVWNSATFAAAGRENLQEVEETLADGTVQKVSKVVKKEKAERKCGKCGESGHNARTCSGKGKKK